MEDDKPAKPAVPTYTGRGHVLGMTEYDSRVIEPTSAQSQQKQLPTQVCLCYDPSSSIPFHSLKTLTCTMQEDKEIKIIFFSNGFCVDDGENPAPLRSMDDPANQPFLDSIKKGYASFL